MRCSFKQTSKSCLYKYAVLKYRYVDTISNNEVKKYSLLFKLQPFVWLFVFSIIPLLTFSQNRGYILGNQCITYGNTPTKFKSLRDASGGTISWQKADNANFTNPTIISGANSQEYTESVGLIDITFYRRILTNGTTVLYSDTIKVTIVGSVVSPIFTPNISSLPEVCQGTTTFSVPYSTTNSPDKYSIIWNTAASAEGFKDVLDATLAPAPNNITVAVPTNASPNTYTGTLVATISATGCTGSNASAIKINALPTITGSLSVCSGSNISLVGSATAAATSPWLSSNSSVATINSVGLLTGVSAGTTSITYTNTAGCSTTNIVSVNALPTASINGSVSVCKNDSPPIVRITGLGGLLPYTFTYTLNGVTQTATTSGGNSFVDITAVTTSTGTFTYTLVSIQESSSLNCTNTANGSAIIKVNVLPTATISAGGATTFCSGNSVNLTASTGSAWLWDTGETTQTISISTTANKTVTVTDVNNCSATSSATLVTVNPLPTISLTSGATTVCLGATTTLLNTTSGGVWVSSNNLISTISSVGIVSGIAVGASTITYTVTNTNGCKNSAVTFMNVLATPTIPTITALGPVSFCFGTSVILQSNSGTGNQWYKNNVLIAGQTNQTYTANSTGTFTVLVTNGSGCVSNSNSLGTVVTVNPFPNVSPITGNTTLCVGSTSQLTSSTLGGIWSSNNSIGIINSVSGLLSGISAGNSIISYKITLLGCATTITTTTTVNAKPQTPTATNSGTVCEGAALTLNTPTVNGASYVWTHPNGFSSSLQNPSITKAIPASAGTYSVIVITNGCSSAAGTTVVTINPLPIITVSNPSSVCEPFTIDLTSTIIIAGSGPGISYSYWKNALATTPLPNAYAVSISNTYFIKGTIPLTGCSVTMPVIATIHPLQSGSIQTPSQKFICDGIPLVLTANANADNYQWYVDQKNIPGATSNSFAASVAGKYGVRFTSNNGCIDTAINLVNLILFIKPTLEFVPDKQCLSNPIYFINRSSFATSGNITWVWNFGDGVLEYGFSTTHSYLKEGMYNISLSAENSDCINLTNNITKAIFIESPISGIRYAPVNAVMNEPTKIMARSFGSKYQWQPFGNLNNYSIQSPIVTIDTNKTFTVLITSAEGCETTDTVTVNIFVQSEIFVPQGFTPNGDGQNDRLYPIPVQIAKLNYFKVFNRLGNLVFQTNDASPSNGWNGKFNGTDQPAGTFTWIAEGIDVGGKNIIRSGNVMLIR